MLYLNGEIISPKEITMKKIILLSMLVFTGMLMERFLTERTLDYCIKNNKEFHGIFFDINLKE